MSMLLNVKLPPPPNAEHPHLTRFQAKNPPHLLGSTLLNIPCEPSDSVASLRAKVEALCGEPVEMLKKGGGGGKGELLADGNTLADCGLTTSMSIYEHLWVDSAANQAAFWAEYEKMASYVKTQRDFLNEVSK